MSTAFDLNSCQVLVETFVMALPSLFDQRRTAQAAAYLLSRAGTGRLPMIKLMKLLYLAERLSLQRYGEPLTGDLVVAMPHGPVLSRTYDHVKGAVRSCEDGWDTWIADQAEYFVALRDPSMVRSPEQDLTLLSDADLEVLGETWDQFGHMERFALVQYTHDNCPEWQDPEGSSYPIPYERLFEVMGYKPDEIKALISRLQAQASLNTQFS